MVSSYEGAMSISESESESESEPMITLDLQASGHRIICGVDDCVVKLPSAGCS